MTSPANINLEEQPHILVIDDDSRIRQLVFRFLKENGFIVTTAPNTKQAQEIMSRFSFDALVVDIMMPGESGLEFTKRIRQEGNNTPVLLLTALGEADDRIAGLETGADDYLPKPFEPKELVLRLQSLLRRSRPALSKTKSFRIGRWQYDPLRLQIQSDAGDIISLTAAENTLMLALSTHAGQTVDRDELARLCKVDPQNRTIDVQVTRLRKKIEDDQKTPRYLQTVRGKGYRLLIDQL